MTKIRLAPHLLGLAGAFALVAAACSGSSSNPSAPSVGSGTSGGATLTAGGGSTAPQAPTTGGSGTLSVMMTDSPFTEALAVLVTISEVSVHRTGGAWETVPLEGGAITCDLKQLEGPVDLLAGGTLPAGKYTQIRLTVGRADIYFDNPVAGTDACQPAAAVVEPEGLRGEVVVPSGVIRLNRPFTLAAEGITSILLDFDGDASIRRQGNPNAPLGCEPESDGPEDGADEGTGHGNNGRGGGNGNNGNGNGNNGSSIACDPENAGTYRMTPVIAVVGVDEAPGP
jgi:hypothetical protein